MKIVGAASAAIGNDCDTLHVSDIVLELYGPDADLNADDRIGIMEFPDHPGYRFKVIRPDLP